MTRILTRNSTLLLKYLITRLAQTTTDDAGVKLRSTPDCSSRGHPPKADRGGSGLVNPTSPEVLGHREQESSVVRLDLSQSPVYRNRTGDQLMESVCTPLQSTALPTELKPGGGLSRHVQDSNLRGQSPMDFESNSLTARTTCLEEKVTPWESKPVNRAREALGVKMCIDMCRARPPSGTTGLEPVRARPNRFLVELLNHSDKCP